MKIKGNKAPIVAMAIVCGLGLPASGERGRSHKINFNGGWEFRISGDSAWRPVTLPHDYQIGQPWVVPQADEQADKDNPMANIASRLSARAFKEPVAGEYRKCFVMPEEWRGRRVVIDFEGIMLTGEAWLNGHKIGSTDYGYLGFESDITPYLREDDNILEVYADAGRPENSRWYTGAGLYRNVSMILTDTLRYFHRHPLHVSAEKTGVDRHTWRMTVGATATHADRPDSVRFHIRVKDPAGKEIYANTVARRNNRKQPVREFAVDTVLISNAATWDLDTPQMYTVEVDLTDIDGKIYDRASARTGLREIEYSPEFGFKLNGEKTLLKGIANHHTLGALGAAAHPDAMARRLRLLKDFGFNHVRTSHNPYSESFLDLCDEMGFLVVDELYDKWTRQFCGGKTSWEERWQHDVAEWALRDRNHSSVVMWSLGNELQLIGDLPFNDWGVTPYRLQRELLRRYDTTRPVTVAMHPRGRNEFTDSLPAPLALATDIAAYNYRYMYFPGDAMRYPDKIFYQSEANLSNMGPNWWDMDLDKVTGLAYWGMIDYLGESHGWPEKGWTQGVFDITLRPKPMAYFLRTYFREDEPQAYIAPYRASDSSEWNGVKMGGATFTDGWWMPEKAGGSLLNVAVFTNADEVELTVNGKSLGRKRNNRENSKERNRPTWENVEYQPGVIEAVAYRDGEKKPVARHRLETPGHVSRLKIIPDEHDRNESGALIHYDIEAVDKKGRRDPGADCLLHFEIEGPAEIIAVANGDMKSDEPMTGSERRLYHGAAQVIARRTGSGPVKLRVDPSEDKSFNTTIDALR